MEKGLGLQAAVGSQHHMSGRSQDSPPALEATTAQRSFLAARAQEFGEGSDIVELLRRCCALYGARGLLPEGEDRPLFAVCPHSPACWEGQTQPMYPAGVSAPWVGVRYCERRIAIIGTNFDRWGGLGAHWDICRSHISAQLAGKPGKDGRFFATGAMAYAAAVDACLDGDGDRVECGPELDPKVLARTWNSCAFLEAVKCSPPVARGRPTAPMMERCPPFLLREELEILEPRVVILLGRGPDPRDIVRPLLNVTWGTHPGAIERDTFVLGGKLVTLFSCNHPSVANRDLWRRSYDQLRASLAERGLP